MSNRKKKIVIHGATNTSNFGDVLFASLFMQKLSESSDAEVFFLEVPRYGVGSFVRKELSYSKHLKLSDALTADALVYMSGGYFGDNEKSLFGSAQRWIRYMLYGQYMACKRCPIYLCGVGGGPLYSNFLKKVTVGIMNKATYISMRDIESAQYFIDAGVNVPIRVTADSALTITREQLPMFMDFESMNRITQNKKVLLVHIVMNSKADELFANNVVPAINRYIKEHPEYAVVVTSDSQCDYTHQKAYAAIVSDAFYAYKYTSAWQLCSLIGYANIVVTMKLHVGIVASSLGKSVISFPMHRHKTKRFYKQLGETERCMELTSITAQKAYELLKKYEGIPIDVPQKLRDKAVENFRILDDI